MSSQPPAPIRPYLLGPRALRVIGLAHREREALDHRFTGPDHLLLGLVVEGHNVGARALADRGVSAEAVRDRSADVAESQVHSPETNTMSEPGRRAMSDAGFEAERLGRPGVEPQHLLLALLGHETPSAILTALDVDLDELRRAVEARSARALPGRLPDLTELQAEWRRLQREAHAAFDGGDRETHLELWEQRKAVDEAEREQLRRWAADTDITDAREILAELDHLRAEVARLRSA